MNQFIIISAVLGILSYILMDPKLAQSEFLRRKSSSRLLIGESTFIFLCFIPCLFWLPIFTLWIMGIAVSAGFFFHDRWFVHRIKAERIDQTSVYATNLPTAFVTCEKQPKIVLPADLEVVQKRWILVHELYHIRHNHHYLKLAFGLFRMLFWFNPGAYLLYSIGTEILEQRCNAAVEKELTAAERIKYQNLQRQLTTSTNLFVLGFSDQKKRPDLNSDENQKKQAKSQPQTGKKKRVLAAGMGFAAAVFLIGILFFWMSASNRFGQDQAALEKLLAENPRNKDNEMAVLAPMPQGLEDYECSLIPLNNTQEILVFIDRDGISEAQLVWNIMQDKLVKAYLPAKQTTLSEERCLEAAQTAGRYYRNEEELKQAREKAIEYSGGELIIINECAAFPEFNLFQLRFGPVDNTQFYIEMGAHYKLLWNRQNHKLDRISGGFYRTSISEQRLEEIAAQTAGFYEQSVDQTKLCYIGEDQTILCPNNYYKIPKAIPFVYPAAMPQILSDSFEYGVQGLDIASQSGSLEVLAAAEGRVEKIGYDQEWGAYMILDHGHRKTFYGGLSDQIWMETWSQVEQGQVIATMREEKAPVHVHFAVLENNQAAADSRKYLEYSLIRGRQIQVPQRVQTRYTIDKTQWKEIVQLVKGSTAFEEYTPNFTPKVEHNYGTPISEIMVTAQPNDFSTLTLVQNSEDNQFDISRSYLFKVLNTEVLPGCSMNLVVNVAVKQKAGKSSAEIAVNVDLNDHQYSAEGIYDPEKRILIQNDVLMSYMDVDAEIRSAVVARIEEIMEKAQQIDEKALALSDQILQIITGGQPISVVTSSLYEVLGR